MAPLNAEIEEIIQPEVCVRPKQSAWPGWAPLVVLPGAAIAGRALLMPWAFMWVLCGAIFFGCKWHAWWEQKSALRPETSRSVGFLLAWPGMDAAAFLDSARIPPRPRSSEWFWALAKTAIGATLLWGVVRIIPPNRDLLVGWTGMLGLILLLHFGTFHLASLLWRSAGVDAPPIMHAPLSATSLSEFWGRRWNLGFRQLTYRLIFRPARARWGVPTALLLSFFVSGWIHELVISVPARAGYGLPTLYFVLQGVGILFERSTAGERLGIDRGIRGWWFAFLLAATPAGLLFHPPFVRTVILPFFSAIGAR